MDFKFEKGYENDAPQGQDKGRQTVLLIVLLLLLGGFGYLYFFTGLIRPQEQPAPPPQPVPQMVKQPLPAREGASAPAPSAAMPGTAASTAPQPATPPITKPAPAQSAPGPAKPVKPVASPPAKQLAAKPAIPSEKTDKHKAGTAAVKPVAPKPEASVESPKAATVAKKVHGRVATKKPVAAKRAVKATASAKLGGPWTVVVGSYVLEERLAADMAKVKGAGLTPAMTTGQRRLTTMYRLKYGEYVDRGAAQQAVELLKKQAGDGFAIQKGAKHEVFAGSYAQLESARAEQQRLAASGIKVNIQKSQVGVPTRKLTAGTFTNRTVAEGALKKLKQAGIGTPSLE